MKQLPLPISPAPADGFDNLVVGRNAAAVQHLRELGLNRIAVAPVYLWGAVGTGKTRLLRALASQQQLDGARVGWFDAATPLPWVLDEAWRLVLVDDCEALDPEQQQAAFALFVEAGAHGVQWVGAGRWPPVDLKLRDDLRTRLGWGHIFHLQTLSEPERRAVLRQAADARGVFLGDEVMDFMLTRFSRDLGSLMELLDLLDGYALQTQRALTIPLVKSMLENA